MVAQPYLHDLHAVVAAPVQAWYGPDGQLRPSPAQGWYVADSRVLAGAVVTVGGAEPAPLVVRPAGAGALTASFVPREVDTPDPDPTVRLDRHVTVTPRGVVERYELTCATPGTVAARLVVRLEPDGTGMDAIRVGGARRGVDARVDGDGRVLWRPAPGVDVVLTAPGARVTRLGADGGGDGDLVAIEARWDVVVAPGEPVVVGIDAALTQADPVVVAPVRAEPEWSRPDVVADDPRLAPWLARALDDLAGLRMTAAFAPDDVFLAAGAPWFFTLFGRDSLWAARMLLPLGTDLARGTLRTLAARQGTRVDPVTAEEPGKVLHEVRHAALALGGDGVVLPPVYYGTVDATALWVCLLHDAWRWGMADDDVEALLRPLEAALGWIVEHGDPDGDGFLEYVDRTGHGLANQGWKDSGDSVQWRDGRLATAPIALVEVQGYAYAAAVGGADVLDAFGRPGADRWREWASRLAVRFRSSFWVDDDAGAYPGIALDGGKRLVDSVTSNIGHLLGTGLLSAEEERAVADRLVRPDMATPFGLRTLAAGSGGYWPLRYHGGAVWPHDTAIVLAGMAAGGHAAQAAVLADGLLAAAHRLDGRLPELWSGEDGSALVPYPAACRPQAWSAAASVAVLASRLGLRPDVPGGVLHVGRPGDEGAGALRVRGLRVAGRPLDVEVVGGVPRVRTDAPVRVVGPGAPA